MSLPNLLTLSRIGFLFLIAILLYLSEQFSNYYGLATVAAVLFGISGLTDWIDGYTARKWNMVSDFGKLMDALVDKIFVTGVFVILLTLNMLPGWAMIGVLLIICREFLITGLRMVAIRKGLVLPAEKSGKLKTFSQFVALSFLLMAVVLERDIAFLVGTDLQKIALGFQAIGEASFLFAVGLTLFSGFNYLYYYQTRQARQLHQKRHYP